MESELDKLGSVWVDMGKHGTDTFAVGIEATTPLHDEHYVLWVADNRRDKHDKSRSMQLAQEVVDAINFYRAHRHNEGLDTGR